MTPADRRQRPQSRKPSAGTTARGSANAASKPFVLLDNSTGNGLPSVLFTDPVEIVRTDTPDEVEGALHKLMSGTKRGLNAAGFLSYELGYVLEPRLMPLLPDKRRVPLLWFGLFRASEKFSDTEVVAWLDKRAEDGHTLSDVGLSWDGPSYVRKFDEVLEKIRAGDIYQLNLTFKARFRLQGSPFSLYRDLRLKQRVAYAGIIDTGEVTVLSASPELFIEKDRQVVSTRPMKGTAPRAGTLEADAEARRVLSTDVKQRAENLMIVDLMRNDLGRISEIGSVHVTDLFTVETFKTLHQMTSGIRATLQKDVDLVGLLKAIFPAGSIVGAPKIRVMELIREFESEPRGVYCGAIGGLSPEGQALFNVAIRTAVIARDGTGEMGIGSGVVWDSQGAKEYAECLLKMKFLTDPVRRFDLIETLLFEPSSGFSLLNEHFERLQRSAAYFGFPFDQTAVLNTLMGVVKDRRAERLRVRLLLAENGTATVTLTPLPPADPAAVMRYVVSPTRLESTNPFLYHKTTRRELYDTEWDHYAKIAGSDEVIYLNERGELAEGSRTTIFIERGGRLETPPLASGLLPGTLRAHLIAEGRAVERVLTLADLQAGDPVYLGNSVRGLVKAQPLTEDG